MRHHSHDRTRRRLATRLLLASTMAVAMLASPIAGGPALAGPPADRLSPDGSAPTVANTTCSAFKAGFSAASGNCQNPSQFVTFRVNAQCRQAPTGALYHVQSPVVSSFDTAHAFCDFFWPDPVISWSVQVFDATPPDLSPVISNLRCEYIGSNRFFCSLSATGWTQIRWTYNGFPRAGWNDRLETGINTCAGGIPLVKAFASNSHGTTTRQVSFECSGPPL